MFITNQNDLLQGYYNLHPTPENALYCQHPSRRAISDQKLLGYLSSVHDYKLYAAQTRQFLGAINNNSALLWSTSYRSDMQVALDAEYSSILDPNFKAAVLYNQVDFVKSYPDVYLHP